MTFLDKLSFLYNTTSIIFTEVLSYAYYRDKTLFIEGLTHRLAKVNILYVKIFQAFALNNSLIDQKMNNTLLKFTDNAPWTNDDIDYETLFKLEDNEHISFTDSISYPINSGMISLVYKAKKTTDNSNVIVKIKRKNIEHKLDDAIENLLFIVKILSYIPLFNKYQLSEAINKNIDMIRHQVNFDQEVQNILKIKNNCKNLKYVIIPNVFKEITDKYKDVILMEEIIGVPIHNLKEEDYEGFAMPVIKFGFVTILVHGVTHGDLHGGNLLFIKDENDPKYKYKIGVLDFGIIYEIDTKHKGFLFDLISEMFNDTPEVSAEKFFYSGMFEPVEVLRALPKEHCQNILKIIADIIRDAMNSSKNMNQIQVYKFLSNFKKYTNDPELSKLGIRPSDNFVKTQMVLGMAHGVTLTLCKDDYVSFADKALNELFHTNLIF